MAKEFIEFIDINKGKTVWFATSAGLFQGKINMINPETIELVSTLYFTGNIRLSVGKVSLIMKDIIAWGITQQFFCKMHHRSFHQFRLVS